MSGLTINRILAAVLLAMMAVHQELSFYRAPGVDEYHARIREAADRVPTRIGPWVGEDVPMRVQALSVLHPNALISRHYVNVETGATADVLLVHCADAHSIVGHFPARCYPAQGWTLAGSGDRDWVVGDLRLTGEEYEFTMTDPLEAGGVTQDIIVDNCLFRPGGLVLRDMTSLSALIVGAEAQSTGAGELQVVFDAGVGRQERDQTIAALADGYRPVIDAMLSRPGVQPRGNTN